MDDVSVQTFVVVPGHAEYRDTYPVVARILGRVSVRSRGRPTSSIADNLTRYRGEREQT